MVAIGAEGKKSENDVKGVERPLAGRYHVVIKEVDESFTKFDKIIIEFQILAGTVPDQVGLTLTEFFAVTEKALSRLQRLALTVGLLQPGEAEKDVSFAEAIGRQLVIEVEDNEYEKDGKKVKGVRVGFLSFWSLGNAEVSDVPKDAGAIKVFDEVMANSAQSEQQATSGQVAAGGDKWANL